MKERIKKVLSWVYFVIFISAVFWFGLVWFIPTTPLMLIIITILIFLFVKSIKVIWRENKNE